MWNDQLNNRTAEEKGGTKGKMIFATYTQTQVYLKPLLQKLKNRSLPEDISDSLTEIVRHLLNRNYLMVRRTCVCVYVRAHVCVSVHACV